MGRPPLRRRARHRTRGACEGVWGGGLGVGQEVRQPYVGRRWREVADAYVERCEGRGACTGVQGPDGKELRAPAHHNNIRPCLACGLPPCPSNPA